MIAALVVLAVLGLFVFPCLQHAPPAWLVGAVIGVLAFMVITS